MEKSHRKSITKRKISVIKPGNRQSKIITQREAYENGLNKIFSQPPSHLGYKNDIEALLNELGIKMEELLYLTISSLSRISRNKNEIKIIASYLYLMPDIIKLLKGKDMKKKEQLILKDLISLSESMTYEKYQKNFILTKFGDIGSTAYVILDGQVDVLIKSFKNMNISKYDYLFYLANLLKYSEYGLLNEAINENFSKFPLEIYDSFNRTSIGSIKYNDSLLKKNDSNIPNQKKEILTDDKAKINNINQDNSNKVFILNDENKEIKEFKKVYKITINKLMEMFNLKMTEKKNLIFCTLNDYVNRIELIPDDYRNYIKKIYLKKRKSFLDINDKEKNKDKVDDDEDENGQYNLKIFSYSKVATLGKGTLFGEIALQDANSLRTGTIITSSDCHCSILNKKTFDLCLKKGAEKYLKELLNFFIELPIFIGIQENVFYHKYYTFLSKKNMIRGKNIITQGEKPENIVILQTGSYGLTTRISLFDLTKLIYHFIKLNLNNRNTNDIFDEDIKKYKRLLRRTQKIINDANSLMNQNLKFKKFYVNEVYIRITDITCPDIVGYKEYVDENGLYAFTIETKSPENIIYILENKIYNELQSKNVIVKKNQKELLEKKINVMIQRLLIIRNSLVNSFFDSKSEKEISSLIIKELEDLSISKLKQKRFLKFKSTAFKFNKNNKDSKDNDNFKINISPEKEKFKKIKKLSRNFKINKNLDFNNSESKTELKQNFVAKSISSSYNKNNNFKRPNTNKKISKRVMNLYKSSRNFNSAKKINENNNLFNKKNFFLDVNYSKEKSQISSHNLKELNLNFKLKQKKMPKSSYKKIDEVQCAENSYTPKLNSAHDSCKNFQTNGIFLNNLVWEEIKSKIRNQFNYNYKHENYSSTHRNKNLNFFEQSSSFKTNNFDETKPPFTSDRFYNDKIMTKNKDNNLNIKLINKTPKLYKSSSELSLQKKIRLKSSNHFNSAKLLKINKNISEEITDIAFDNNMMNNYNHFFYPEKIVVPKINLRIKKMFSPQEINFMRQMNRKNKALNILKYYEKKCEKYRLERKIYYNNNLKNRMKLFYGTERTKIKI